jgi:hypothetical protein
VQGSGGAVRPTPSPDGKKLAFTSDRGGGDNVWISDRDGSNAKQVTKESFRLLNGPAWSPDGQWIAARKHFSSRRSLGTGEIFLYHVTGGEGLQLGQDGAGPCEKGERADGRDPAQLRSAPDGVPHVLPPPLGAAPCARPTQPYSTGAAACRRRQAINDAETRFVTARTPLARARRGCAASGCRLPAPPVGGLSPGELARLAAAGSTPAFR